MTATNQVFKGGAELSKCVGCGTAFHDQCMGRPDQRRCDACRKSWGGQREAAYRVYRAALKRGDIPPVRYMFCIDCGSAAEHYDHRDYSKPLEVEPVCRDCNMKRGPGKRMAA